MKQQKLLIVTFILCSIANFTKAQVIGIGSASSQYEMVFIPGEKEDNSAEFKKIAPKMYLNTAYLPAYIEGIKETFYLRYNAYRDEMEFIKNEETLYLKKKPNRKIKFRQSKQKYGLFKLNGKLRYFLLQNEGDNVLLTRQVVEYIEAKPAASSYQKDRPANFKRKSDTNYISFKNKEIVELSNSKKKFFQVFGENSVQIKKYVKSNKLNIKKIEDLEKIVNYLNSL